MRTLEVGSTLAEERPLAEDRPDAEADAEVEREALAEREPLAEPDDREADALPEPDEREAEPLRLEADADAEAEAAEVRIGAVATAASISDVVLQCQPADERPVRAQDEDGRGSVLDGSCRGRLDARVGADLARRVDAATSVEHAGCRTHQT